MAEFDSKLEQALTRYIPGCSKLVSVERLSGGASQETYRLNAVIKGTEQQLALRRSPGGQYVDPVPTHPGLAVEALLMKCAYEAGVPAPEVYHVLTREDDLGDGIIMEWVVGTGGTFGCEKRTGQAIERYEFVNEVKETVYLILKSLLLLLEGRYLLF